jgi:hypothetical protein
MPAKHPAKRPRIKMPDDTLRARVFISCGQNKESGEHLLATEIQEELTLLGFDPYVATSRTTL